MNTVAAPVRSLTTYDLLKTVLVVLMVIDHVGFFFFPDDLMLRAIGRACVPAWFFLVGYGRARSDRPGFDAILWIAAAIMWGAQWAGLHAPFPLNVLVNIALIRIALPYLDMALARWWTAVPLFLALAWANIDLYGFIEYGTLGWLLAIWGWLAGQGRKFPARLWAIPSVALFILHQTQLFDFVGHDLMIMLAGVIAMMVWLWRFTGSPIIVAPLLQPLLHFMGRQTLLIYVLHYLTFAVIAKVM